MPALRSFLLLLLVSVPAMGQELEPGAYSISPVGVNIVNVTNSLQRGDVTFDPALPIEDFRATIDTIALSYFRTLRLFGRSASVGLVAPFLIGSLEGRVQGEPTKVDRGGSGDPRARFSVNLYGAPAMELKEFASYRQKTNVGVSLIVAIPLGQYDPARLINLGSNRWAFKPEVGVSRLLGKWNLDFYGGVWLFTKNPDFYGGKLREQNPIGSAQVHVVYTFRPRLWTALDLNFYAGGRTTVDGTLNADLQKNSRAGLTFSVPLDRRQSLKFALSTGAYTTYGADFQSFVAGYQYLWGAGL
jgi:hypothetical protein